VLFAAMLVPGLVMAGVFFGKKQVRVDPATRVQQLLAIIKTDGDETKRSSAAEELRDYDAAQFPEMIPILADVALSDQKVSVRAEAAHTLGKLRPISQQAGSALEQAASKDSSLRVRLAAKTALMGYYMAGYKSNPKQLNSFPSTKEPPLADPVTQGPTLVQPQAQQPPVPTIRTSPNPVPVQPARVGSTQTVEPPLAGPLPPSPKPSPTPLVPIQSPRLQPAPSSGGSEGPNLFMLE
jgi:hypothetical protein